MGPTCSFAYVRKSAKEEAVSFRQRTNNKEGSDLPGKHGSMPSGAPAVADSPVRQSCAERVWRRASRSPMGQLRLLYPRACPLSEKAYTADTVSLLPFSISLRLSLSDNFRNSCPESVCCCFSFSTLLLVSLQCNDAYATQIWHHIYALPYVYVRLFCPLFEPAALLFFFYNVLARP